MKPTLVIGSLALALLFAAPGFGRSIEAIPDGLFDEWAGAKLVESDPAGDGAVGGLDLGRLWIGDDGEALFLRLEIGRETILQNPPSGIIGNDLRLYLDLDRKKSTGLPIESLGAELEVRFGLRAVIRYDAAGKAENIAPGMGLVIPGARPDVYQRLLAAIRPDIVAFQELADWTPEQTRSFVESVLSSKACSRRTAVSPGTYVSSSTP